MSSVRDGLEYSHGHHSSAPSRKSSSSILSNSSVETTVTKLLMSTKQLLQALTQWSKGTLNEKMVSDAYVQLGNDFKLVSKFFSHSGLEVSDLGDVPMDLRRVLEVALREEPSDETLNKYLPSIREIIVTLLDKLKVKQALLKTVKSERSAKRNLHQQRPSTVSSLSLSNKSTPPSSRTPSVNYTPKSQGQEFTEPRTQRKSGSISSVSARYSSLSSPVTLAAPSAAIAPPSSSSTSSSTGPRQQSLSETEALSELKKGNNLQRRASKRFSAYQMAKLTNHSTTEAAAAGALASVPPSFSNATNTSLNPSSAPPLPAELMAQTMESPTEKSRIPFPLATNSHAYEDRETMVQETASAISLPKKNSHKPQLVADTLTKSPSKLKSVQNESVNGNYDLPTRPYTIFLKIGERTKRCSLQLPTNMQELKLLFVEKFAYSPDEDSFPDLYLRDPKYSVFYELDEQALSDVRDGCVIELHVNQHEEKDLVDDNLREKVEPKNDFSELISSLRAEITKSQEDILGQIRELTLRTQESLKNDESSSDSKAENKHSAISETSAPPLVETLPVSPISVDSIKQMKQELAILKQIYNENKKKSKTAIEFIQSKLSSFKTLSLESNEPSSKTYIENTQNKLGETSDALLSKVDDLQDIIEVLRKDVAVHGVKPSKKKLESVQKELVSAQQGLTSMQGFMKTEKPQWKKIWKSELEKVCEEQQFLTLQEDLAADLKEDLDKALETFDLVNLCCAEQEKHPKRSKSNPILPIPEPGTFHKVRDQVLNEVQALHPDHNERIEALEKAQKLWEKEREYRDVDAFEDELGSFVEKGNLKTSGGVEEVERRRKQKDEENLRAYFGGLDL